MSVDGIYLLSVIGIASVCYCAGGFISLLVGFGALWLLTISSQKLESLETSARNNNRSTVAEYFDQLSTAWGRVISK